MKTTGMILSWTLYLGSLLYLTYDFDSKFPEANEGFKLILVLASILLGVFLLFASIVFITTISDAAAMKQTRDVNELIKKL